MNHTFNKKIAEECGFAAAVILHYFYFWMRQNREAGRNEFDGRTWVYNTIPELSEIFSYLAKSNIRKGLKRLKEAGLIVTGRYNKSGMDRTIWYSVTEKAVDILTEEPDKSPEKSAGNRGNKKTIVRKPTIHCSETGQSIVQKPDNPLSENRQCKVQNRTMQSTKSDDAKFKIELCKVQNRTMQSSKLNDAKFKIEPPIPINNQIYNQIGNQIGNADGNQIGDADVKGGTNLPPLIGYPHCVTMTEKDHLKPVEKYGPWMAGELIRPPDACKGNGGREYKPDHRAIFALAAEKYDERYGITRHNKDQPQDGTAETARLGNDMVKYV